MPTTSKGDKVLVTGANGFVAIWVVQTLLQRGYAIRGTVRTQEKGKYVKDLFKSFGDKFEVVVIPDTILVSAFDESVKGVDAVVHAASPVHSNAVEPNEIIEPAVKSTTNIFRSILNLGSDIKRVVVLSSFAAICEYRKRKLFTEEDWNEASITAVNFMGSKAEGFVKYMASKTLAEKAAWQLYEENKGRVSWDLTVLNPPYVFGPILHEVSSAKALRGSSLDWYRSVLMPNVLSKESQEMIDLYIDVRDLADAHVLALEKLEAGGERIIIAAGNFVWQDFIDSAFSLFPSVMLRPIISQGRHANINSKGQMKYRRGKAERILGMIYYRSVDEITRDILNDFHKRGWLYQGSESTLSGHKSLPRAKL